MKKSINEMSGLLAQAHSRVEIAPWVSAAVNSA
jgi:hypothetical protein